jgi:hypothetical protein
MTNEQPTTTPVHIEEAKSVLRNLCSLASAAMGISREQADGCLSLDALEHRLQLMHYLVDRMGWVADVALRKLGDSGSLARPEDWMLPEA